MRTVFFLLLPLALLLAGCPKDVDVTIPQTDPKLVVASQVIPNALMVVNLTKSFGSLDYGNGTETDSSSADFLSTLFVNGAIVTISYRDKTDTLFPIDTTSGTYVSLFTPTYINETYTLKAEDPKTGMKVVAVSTMLPAVAFDAVSHSIRYDSRNFQLIDTLGNIKDTVITDTIVRFDFSFTDVPNSSYYMVNVYRLSSNGSSSGGSSAGNSLLGGAFGNSAYEQTRLYTDALLSASTVSDSAVYTNLFYPGDTVAVALSPISQTYYDFLVKRQKAGNVLQSILNEPSSYPTNVQGGYGFFNTHNPTVQIRVL